MKFKIQVFYKLHALVWGLLLIPSLTLWKESVPWLVFISVYAIIASSLAGLRDPKTVCEFKEEEGD